MKVMAIDASTKSTGIALFDDNKLYYYQNIISTRSNTYARIWQMAEKIEKIYEKHQPTDIIMEDVIPSDVRNNQNVFKALIYLQALVVLKLYQHNANVNFYVSSHWRSLCGIKAGRGVKRQSLKQASIKLIQQKYGLKVNDDISDAICIGIAYLQQYGSAF